ncbi:MAG: hypothetical protein WBV82_27565 [Myxococcaceae bacterium]
MKRNLAVMLLWSGAAYPAEQRATRPVEFFRTHPPAVEACVAQGNLTLGRVELSKASDAFALLSAAPLGRREEGWVLLAQQTLVAVCNGRLFGAVTPDPLLIADALTALQEARCVTLELLEATLDRFNHSGSAAPLPAGFDPGPPTPGVTNIASLDVLRAPSGCGAGEAL